MCMASFPSEQDHNTCLARTRVASQPAGMTARSSWIDELWTENNDLHRRLRFLEQTSREVEQHGEEDMWFTCARTMSAASVQASPDRSRLTRLLWQTAIFAVRAQNSQVQKSVLKMRMHQAEAKAMEAAQKSFELQQELSRLTEESSTRICQAEKQEEQLLQLFARETMDMKRAHDDEIAFQRSMLVGPDTSLCLDLNAWRDMGISGKPLSEELVSHQGSELGVDVSELLTYTRALEEQLLEAEIDQEELKALRQHVQIFELKLQEAEPTHWLCALATHACSSDRGARSSDGSATHAGAVATIEGAARIEMG